MAEQAVELGVRENVQLAGADRQMAQALLKRPLRMVPARPAGCAARQSPGSTWSLTCWAITSISVPGISQIGVLPSAGALVSLVSMLIKLLPISPSLLSRASEVWRMNFR